MDAYTTIKWLHILSSTLLFGTGLGTAFHGWRSHRSGDPRVALAVGRSVVLADWIFTAPAVVVQPVTGVAMARMAGYPWDTSWLVAAVILYLLVGACWLPVVWIQIRLHRLASAAATAGTGLGPEFRRLSKIWFALGWPAFAAAIGIFWLMVAKPDLW